MYVRTSTVQRTVLKGAVRCRKVRHRYGLVLQSAPKHLAYRHEITSLIPLLFYVRYKYGTSTVRTSTENRSQGCLGEKYDIIKIDTGTGCNCELRVGALKCSKASNLQTVDAVASDFTV